MKSSTVLFKVLHPKLVLLSMVWSNYMQSLEQLKKVKFPCKTPFVSCLHMPNLPHSLTHFSHSALSFVQSRGFPGGSEVKASASRAGDPGSNPGSGRSPGEGNGNPLQYSCLENPMDGGAWWATVHGVTKSWTRLRDFTFTLVKGSS